MFPRTPSIYGDTQSPIASSETKVRDCKIASFNRANEEENILFENVSLLLAIERIGTILIYNVFELNENIHPCITTFKVGTVNVES